MTKKIYFKLIFIYIITLQLILSGCSSFNSIIPNTNNNTFSKKSVPDQSICDDTNKINLGLSKYTVSKNQTEPIVITTHIPEKYQDLINLSGAGVNRIVVRISKAGSFSRFEKEIPIGCNSFEWDLKTTWGEQFEEGKFNVEILFGSLGNTLNDVISSFDTNTIPTHNAFGLFYCDGILRRGFKDRYNNTYDCSTSRDVKSFLDVDDIPKQITSTNIQISDDPEPIEAGTEFLEVSDVKTLHDLASKLKIDDYNANNLYNSYKILEGYQSQRASLNDRLSQPNISEETTNQLNAKIQSIDSSIANIQSNISSLRSSVMVQLSTLNNNAINLANHINTVTKTQYITPYPPEDKPDSVGGYSGKLYLLNSSIETLLLENGVSLYLPDDPEDNDFKETWEINQERVEYLNPENILDGSKYVSDEIQTAKDLATEIALNSYSDFSDELEAVDTLRDFVSSIKTHTGLLETQSKLYEDKFINNFETLKEQSAELQQTIFLPLALALEQEAGINNNTYIYQISRTNPQDIKNFNVKGLLDWLKAKYEVAKTFTTIQGSIREKVIAFVLGYTANEWNSFRTQDPDGAKGLIDATAEIIEAFGVPTSWESLAFTLAGGPLAKHVGKIFSRLSNSSISTLLKKGVLSSAEKGYISKLKNYLKNLQAKFNKYFYQTKILKDCIKNYSGKAFRVQAICPVAAKFLENYFKKNKIVQNSNLRKRYYEYSGIVPSTKVLSSKRSSKYKNYLSNYLKSDAGKKYFNPTDPDQNFTKLVSRINSRYNNFEKNGLKIKKSPKYEIYAADLEEHAIATVEILEMKGNSGTDYSKAFESLKNHPIYKDFIPQNITKFEDFDKFRESIGLTWHHHEGLNKMILIDHRIHGGINHWGAVNIITNLLDKYPFMKQTYLDIINSMT